MNITLVVVDDNEVDRYIVRRKLSRHDAFGEIIEASSGSNFLDELCDDIRLQAPPDHPVLILMDINMPMLNGFETVDKLHERIAEGLGPRGTIVLMHSSSENPDDLRRANEHPLVAGSLPKPINGEKIDQLIQYCQV